MKSDESEKVPTILIDGWLPISYASMPACTPSRTIFASPARSEFVRHRPRAQSRRVRRCRFPANARGKHRNEGGKPRRRRRTVRRGVEPGREPAAGTPSGTLSATGSANRSDCTEAPVRSSRWRRGGHSASSSIRPDSCRIGSCTPKVGVPGQFASFADFAAAMDRRAGRPGPAEMAIYEPIPTC